MGTRKKACTIVSIIVSLPVLSSCGNRVYVPADVGKEKDRQVAIPQQHQAETSQILPKQDLSAQDVISQTCLEAWRKALAGDKAGAMKQLRELDKKYPKVPTISFMMGEVLEHCGDKKGAIPYYQESVNESDFSSVHRYKLAEAMRTTGDAKGAIKEYRKLVEAAPTFAAGRLGLARALLQMDPKSAEAKEQVNEVLQMEPDNPDALALLAKKGNTVAK
jgi:predicted Zn-dependent protease